MSTSAREAVWVLLSDLFVDTENTERDLRAIGQALKKTGFSEGEVKLILRKEVAPSVAIVESPDGSMKMFSRECSNG